MRITETLLRDQASKIYIFGISIEIIETQRLWRLTSVLLQRIPKGEKLPTLEHDLRFTVVLNIFHLQAGEPLGAGSDKKAGFNLAKELHRAVKAIHVAGSCMTMCGTAERAMEHTDEAGDNNRL